MMAAYTGLFHVYRSLISVVEEPVLNCVVVALLFGKVDLLESTIEPSPVSQPSLPPPCCDFLTTMCRYTESTHRIQLNTPKMNPTAQRLLIQLLFDYTICSTQSTLLNLLYSFKHSILNQTVGYSLLVLYWMRCLMISSVRRRLTSC